MRCLSLTPWVLAGVLSIVPATSHGASFLVIVNANNSVASLSPSDLKRLVSGVTKTWDGGVVVQLAVIPGDAPETIHLASLLGLSTRELLALIQQQVFKGELRRPAILRSSGDCMAAAASSPGAWCTAAEGTPLPAGAKVVPVQ